VVICLERGADLHIVQLMSLPLTVSCSSKIQIGFTFLVPAHPGCPGQRAVKRVCVCVCACYYFLPSSVQLPSAPTKLRPYGAIQICLLLLLLLFPDFPATVLMQQFRSQCECEEAGRCRGQGALQSFCGQRGAGLLANSLAAQEKCSAVLHRSHRRPYKHTHTHTHTHTQR